MKPLRRTTPVFVVDEDKGAHFVFSIGDDATGVLAAHLRSGVIRHIRLTQILPRPAVYTLTNPADPTMTVRMPHKSTDEARAEAVYHGHTQSATEVFIPLATGWYSFERNPASLALWGMYAAAQKDADAWEAVLYAGISTWHAAEIVLMDKSHAGLELLLERRQHAARYLMSFTDPSHPIRSHILAFEARKRLRSVLYSQRGI